MSVLWGIKHTAIKKKIYHPHYLYIILCQTFDINLYFGVSVRAILHDSYILAKLNFYQFYLNMNQSINIYLCVCVCACARGGQVSMDICMDIYAINLINLLFVNFVNFSMLLHLTLLETVFLSLVEYGWKPQRNLKA